ncbi:MAG: allantoin racemase [Oleiphilaceae bacterium]|jgi:Asp/Glu/hydantoin racemase
MKLLILNPNISGSVSELIEKEALRSISAGTQISMLTATLGVSYIETRAESILAAYAALNDLATHFPGHDAAIIAAFGDPGLQAAREILPIPVVGLTESSLMTAAMLGGKIGIIAISRRIKAWYEETIASYGMSERLCGIRCLDKPFSDIGNIQSSNEDQLVSLCQQAINEDGADVLILAGAPLAGLARGVADRIPVPIVDGVSCAVHQAELLARLGARKAMAGSYASPPTKDSKGLSGPLSELMSR